MTVDPRTSLAIVREELENCKKDSQRYGWEISEIDGQKQIFIVKMKSPIDNQQYIMEIKFDNYKEYPLCIEFIHPETGERGTKNAYPAASGKYGGFFHDKPCICHPCSRKAYKGYGDLHTEWNIVGWQQNPQIGTLTNIRAILNAIYFRISDPEAYRGMMHG